MTQLNRMAVYYVTALFLLAASPSPSNGSQIYFNDFDGGLTVAPGVTDTLGGITSTESVQGYDGIGSSSNTFEGNFLRNTTGGEPIGVPGSPTTLTLTGLPPHTSIDINFLLAIIDSWDRSAPGEGPGACTDCHPDILTVTVDGNPVFSEAFGFNGPVFIPPLGVLLTEFDPLGFNSDFGDAAYDMGLNPTFDNIPHSANSLTIEWVASGDGWQGGDDESWAIDNLEVVLTNTVVLDIKPGGDPNSINLKSKGKIAVAILTTADFDATTVDPLSVKFGPDEAVESHGRGHIEDVDGDGDLDLVLHFKTTDAGIQCGDPSASLSGATIGGQMIEGSDSIRTVGCILMYIPNFEFADYEEIVDGAQELSALLEERIDIPVAAVVPPADQVLSSDAVIGALQSGEADLALLGWSAYLVAHETAGAEAALSSIAFGGPFFESQVLTFSGSGVSALRELAGRSLCWVDPMSISGYIVPSIMLRAAGVDPDATAVFAGSHIDVVRDLYYHDCDGGATFVDAREMMVDELPDVYDVVTQLATSPPIPNAGFSFRASLPAGLRNEVVDALLDISDSPQGLELLSMIIGLPVEALVEQDHSFYSGLETLIGEAGLTPQEVWEIYYH